jgi:hypothetical protein
MSAVNWMRANVPLIERASAAASVVLPTPGTSSMSRWPRASRPMTASRTTSGLPTMQRATFFSRLWIRSRSSGTQYSGGAYTVRKKSGSRPGFLTW